MQEQQGYLLDCYRSSNQLFRNERFPPVQFPQLVSENSSVKITDKKQKKQKQLS